ncbi:MAG: sister chromatid cohesion protein PDS5 [Bacteroidota bacterium]
MKQAPAARSLPPSPAAPITLEELVQQAASLDNQTLVEARTAATLQRLQPSTGGVAQEELFVKLGAMALSSLEQGIAQISDEQMCDILLARSGISAAMLKASRLLQAAGQGQHQFPYLTLQEYFAGRALEAKFLSRDKAEQEHAHKFLSEHKYKGPCGKALSFMASEVSKAQGAGGIEKLLRLLAEEQEAVGLQHTFLQLRVLHEWLCIAHNDVEEDMARLEEEFQAISSLLKWFRQSLEHMRRGKRNDLDSAGRKLLALLTNSLPAFRAVVSYASELPQLLQAAAKDQHENVREAACKALVAVAHADPQQGPCIIQLLEAAAKDQHKDVRKAACKALATVTSITPQHALAIIQILAAATKDPDGVVQYVALEALATVAHAAPNEAPAIIQILAAATKDPDGRVQYAALEALATVAHAAPSEAPAIIQLLQATAEYKDYAVRRAAYKILGKMLGSTPAEAPAIIQLLKTAAKDQHWWAREAAYHALGTVAHTTPNEAPAIIQLLETAAKDQHSAIQKVACRALAKVLAAAPQQAPAIIQRLLVVTKDQDEYVREAAIRSLGDVVPIVPQQAPAIIQRLLVAAKDQDRYIREAAIRSLGDMAEATPSETPAITPSLIEAVKDQHEDVRRAGCYRSPHKGLASATPPELLD